MISLQLTFAAAVNPLSADADFQGLMGLNDLPGHGSHVQHTATIQVLESLWFTLFFPTVTEMDSVMLLLVSVCNPPPSSPSSLPPKY